MPPKDKKPKKKVVKAPPKKQKKQKKQEENNENEEQEEVRNSLLVDNDNDIQVEDMLDDDFLQKDPGDLNHHHEEKYEEEIIDIPQEKKNSDQIPKTPEKRKQSQGGEILDIPAPNYLLESIQSKKSRGSGVGSQQQLLDNPENNNNINNSYSKPSSKQSRRQQFDLTNDTKKDNGLKIQENPLKSQNGQSNGNQLNIIKTNNKVQNDDQSQLTLDHSEQQSQPYKRESIFKSSNTNKRDSVMSNNKGVLHQQQRQAKNSTQISQQQQVDTPQKLDTQMQESPEKLIKQKPETNRQTSDIDGQSGIDTKDDIKSKSNNEKDNILQDDIEEQKEEIIIEEKPKKEPKKKEPKVVEYDYKVEFTVLSAFSICCLSLTRFCTKIYSKIRQCTHKMDKKMKKANDKTKNFLNLNSQYIFLFSFMLIIMIFYIGFTADSSSKTEPQGFHGAKKYTANRLISGSIIFTLYGIFFLQIERYIYIYALFIVQGIPCLFLFLYYGYSHYVSEDNRLDNFEIIDTSYAFGIYLFWLGTWLIKEDLKKVVSTNTVNLFLILWCGLAGAVIAGYTVYLTSTTFELNFEWGHQLIKVIGGPYIALLSILWVYIHFRFFQPLIQRKEYKQPKELQEGLDKLKKQEQEREPLMNDQEEHDDINDYDEKNSNQMKLDEIQLREANNPNSQYMAEPNMTNIGAQPTHIPTEPAEQQQIDIQQQQEQQQKEQPEVPLTVKEEKLLQDKERRRRYQNYLVTFTSCVLGGSMLFLTILSTLYVGHHLSLGELKDYKNAQAFFVSLFMIVFVPFFIITATAIIFATVDDKLKLILIPIFGAMIPLLFSVPLSLVIDFFVETRPLRRFFALGPAGVCIWMITLIYIRVDRWKLSMLLNSYICLFFLIPFFYLMPLRSNDTYNGDTGNNEDDKQDDIAYVTQLSLLISGIGLIFLVFAVQQVISVVRTWIQHSNRHKKKTDKQKELEKFQTNDFITNQRFELSNIFIYDLEYFGLWGNAFGYILTFTILIYMYYYAPEYVTKSQSGSLLGLQVAIIFLFFWCLIILMMRIISEKKKEAVSFSEQISGMMESKHEKAILIDRQKKVRWSIVRFSVLENTIFCLVMMIIFWDTEEVRSTFLTMMFGIYVVGGIFCYLYITKRNFDDFSRTAIPALVTFSWIFLYLPFSGILPTSIIYLSEQDEDQVDLERLVIGSTALLLLTGIVLVGLLTHLYFKRREFERKFKFIASKVIKKLAKNHVKSDYSSVNLAFQGYVSKEREQGIQQMTEGKPVYFTEISKFNPDLRFSKMIIDYQTYEKLQNKGKNQQKSRLQKIIDWIMYYYCCYRDWGSDKKNKINDEENVNLLSDGEDNDGEDGIDGAMNRANEANVRRMEEDDLIEEEDPWMKKHLLGQEKSGYYGDIIEALRRYDLSQNLQISKPFQSLFIKHLFQLFAQGSTRKFDSPWIDYPMFKQLMVLSHICPSREFPDYFIDKMYGKFTNYERMANQNPITEKRFTFCLTQIAKIKYPFDPEEHALGKLVKFWLFPYLLWYIKPLHGLYPHEWDYVLFLLKFYNYKDNHDNVIANDVNFRRDLEKYLGIGQDSEKLEKDDGKNGKEPCSWKLVQRLIREWCISFCDNWLYFIKSHCLTDRDMWEPEVDEVEMEVKMVNNTILRPVPFANKRKKAFKHDPSPEWPKVVGLMFEEMEEAEIEYMKIKDSEFAHIKIRNRVTNYMILVFKFIEIYTLGSLAFNPKIEWELGSGLLDLLNFTNTLSPGIEYGTKYVISFIVIFVYLTVNYRSVIRIREGTFGNCESNRKKRNYLSIDFIYVIVVNFVSMIMGFFIIKVLFDAFSCDYSIKPQVMYQDVLQECGTGTHDTYFALSIIGLLMYYPEIGYLWANIQWQNRATDIRYDPTYQTIANQVKVLVACSAAFFAHEDDQVYMCGTSAFILFMFGILTRKMKPCLVKIINPLEMGGYYAAGWMHISAIVTIYSEPLYGYIVLGCGLLIIFLVSFGFWKILRDLQKDNKRKKKIKITNEDGEEEEIEVDINSDDEEEEEERRRKREKEESLEYRIWKKTKEFKEFKEDKEEWLDENLIPYKDDELEQIEEGEEDKKQGEEGGEEEGEKGGDKENQDGQTPNANANTNSNNNNENNSNNNGVLSNKDDKESGLLSDIPKNQDQGGEDLL